MKKRFSDVQVIGILKEQESGVKVSDICRSHVISVATFYHWKSKYGGLEVSEVQKLRCLTEENNRLKALVAHLSLDKVILQEALGKK